jgi:hypothetical protein
VKHYYILLKNKKSHSVTIDYLQINHGYWQAETAAAVSSRLAQPTNKDFTEFNTSMLRTIPRAFPNFNLSVSIWRVIP